VSSPSRTTRFPDGTQAVCIKPDNVLIAKDGRVRVADFGLARSELQDPAPDPPGETAIPRPGADVSLDTTIRSSEVPIQDSGRLLQSPLTQAGAILGTPAYMSPEQHEGQPTDARSDQFSFCAALYEALYRQRPFPGDTVLSLSFNVLQGRLRPPPSQTAVPASIERALRRGLSVDPSDRFPSLRELLQALDVDPRRDPEAAPLARRLFSLVCVLAMFVMVVMARVRGQLSVRDLLWADLLVLLSAVLVVKWQRRNLLGNSFHRGLVSIVLVTLIQSVIVRIAAELFALRVVHVLTLDMILLTGMFALIALSHLRGAWILAAISLLASLAPLLPVKLELTLFTLTYPLVSLGLVWLWSRAASGAKACGLTARPSA
jgi:hypothetical protein